MDNKNVTLYVELDSQETVASVKEIAKALGDLKKLASGIGTAVSKAFAPVILSLQKVSEKIAYMTSALETATGQISELMGQLAEEQVADQWLGIISTVVDGLALINNLLTSGDIYRNLLQKIDFFAINAKFGGVSKVISSTFGIVAGWVTGTLVPAITTALGAIASALGISVGWVVAIIAAIIAAIVAVIVYWDEIKLFFTETLPQLWSQFVEWISGIGASVATLFSSVVTAIGGFFTECWNGIVAIWGGIGEWMQTNVIQPIIVFFTPIVQWFTDLFRNIWQTVSDVFYNIGIIANGCWEIIKQAWSLVTAWFNDHIIIPVCSFFTGLWNTVSTAAINAWNAIKGAFAAIGNWIYTYVIAPVANFFSGLWNGFLNAAKSAWAGVKSVFNNVAQFFSNIFSAAWQGVVKVFSVAGQIFTDIKDGILSAFKIIVNGIIKGINSVVSIPFKGINSAIDTIRNISIFDITPFSGLKTINVPQIPYLAKGAVLPANRPFLAMVGDQRHGTNIEAPLATIQEAMALTMEDFVASNMAGHEATVGVLREILGAVLGIHIGDTVIAQATERYRSKMAVVRGSSY